MSALYFVRHGQASFGEEDYDRLSERGFEQARLLGVSLRERLPEVHLVATGSQRRHKETATACLGELRVSPEVSSAIRELPGLDEFDHQQLLARLDPRYADREQVAADLFASDEPRKAFQELFSRAVARWTCGAYDADYTEPWPDFRRRVLEAVSTLASALGRSQTALVFTSGGPITALCQDLLRIPDSDAFRLSWTLVNCGVTKVLRNSRGLVLSTVNEHAHFEGKHRHLLTYR